jgi:diguanylate cyclase (GGDEF)-like protein/PAS domain S-box-containing protein
MLGFEDHEIGDRIDEWFDRVDPDHLEPLKAAIATHLEGLSEHFEDEHPVRHKDGRYRWMLSRGVAVRDGSNRPCRMAGSQTDITGRKDAEEQLMRSALRDPLTGLANRNLFLSHLRLAVLRARRGDYRFALLFVDLDHFKVVNDSLGHLAGDELLAGAARRLERCVRPADTVARMGGDEFTVLLEDIGGEPDATRVAQRIQEELRHPFAVGGHDVFTSASIGIALGTETSHVAEHVLRDADTALFRAKSLGRGRYQFFDRRMHENALELLQLDTDLRRGLERGEFVAHYQPIVALDSGRVAGFEALARWNHPRRGLLNADEFIPQTEENGLILPLGRKLMMEACRQAREWQERFAGSPPLFMGVNLSGRQFAQPDLAEQVRDTLAECRLEGGSLALEITESVVMDDAGTASRLLSDLKGLNVQLNVDDFGTGYSSLSYLHRFPLDVLKIDASFVRRIGRDTESTEIVRTITTLAHNLGMRVTAEGIETAEQLDALRALGCEGGQGFYFADALPAEQAQELLASSRRW